MATEEIEMKSGGRYIENGVVYIEENNERETSFGGEEETDSLLGGEKETDSLLGGESNTDDLRNRLNKQTEGISSKPRREIGDKLKSSNDPEIQEFRKKLVFVIEKYINSDGGYPPLETMQEDLRFLEEDTKKRQFGPIRDEYNEAKAILVDGIKQAKEFERIGKQPSTSSGLNSDIPPETKDKLPPNLANEVVIAMNVPKEISNGEVDPDTKAKLLLERKANLLLALIKATNFLETVEDDEGLKNAIRDLIDDLNREIAITGITEQEEITKSLSKRLREQAKEATSALAKGALAAGAAVLVVYAFLQGWAKKAVTSMFSGAKSLAQYAKTTAPVIASVFGIIGSIIKGVANVVGWLGQNVWAILVAVIGGAAIYLLSKRGSKQK